MTRSDINFLYIMILLFVCSCALIPNYPMMSLKVFGMFLITGIIWYSWHIFDKETKEKEK